MCFPYFHGATCLCAALMAASARFLLLARFTDFELSRTCSLSSLRSSSSFFSSGCFRSLVSAGKLNSKPTPASLAFSPLNCLIPGIDGGFPETGDGGVNDDFVSTRKSVFNREFSVLANMLKQIEPLDTSVIGKSVSDSSKYSMKKTISTMLGLLPSDHFSVTIRVSPQPLSRLLASSIITGYTLWNAEYRISLTRNFNNSTGGVSVLDPCHGDGVLGTACEERRNERGFDLGGHGIFDREDPEILESLGDLSPEALNYIQELKSELASVEKELNAQKQENNHIEYNEEKRDDLLEYLRSLEPHMVTELSRPSSSEVEEIIQQLVPSILQRLFKCDDSAPDFLDNLALGNADRCHSSGVEHASIISVSRDYLARLLFWCMLLGNHMRSLEYRLHLSCVVRLL